MLNMKRFIVRLMRDHDIQMKAEQDNKTAKILPKLPNEKKRVISSKKKKKRVVFKQNIFSSRIGTA